ncbi:uracil-DNA glycosylase [Caenimonas aquaedulcis]|uniref:Uracil-DNA glycosylase n=1 Tax=Caenimonas aquaedulcis TaxID=2793270 RepID=A0A931H6F1_9BURK|nr:uracil-DNA glycosylase [Caenimonas aquaedulcis]MBG9389302.1 uracil-DNA glycosylase [Caenimonas aquaedulcis]
MQSSLLPDDSGAPRLRAWEPDKWPLADGWSPVVERFFLSAEGQRLARFIRDRLAAGAVVYPPHPLRALELTPPANVHAVIVGQDPYHGPGQAEGLAFSVAPGVKLPPSLRNIFKELHREAPGSTPANGSLLGWAKRGVLLLNTSLTVEEGAAGSHAKQGWEVLTDALLAEVAAKASPCVYMLWGAHAQAKAPLIEQAARLHGREALVLQANHPSPLSASRPPAPFIGCGHFSIARDWLTARGFPGIF